MCVSISFKSGIIPIAAIIKNMVDNLPTRTISRSEALGFISANKSRETKDAALLNELDREDINAAKNPIITNPLMPIGNILPLNRSEYAESPFMSGNNTAAIRPGNIKKNIGNIFRADASAVPFLTSLIPRALKIRCTIY